MSDNAESGIAAAQAKNAQAEDINQHHKTTIRYLNDRIVTFAFCLCFMAMLLFWLTSTSPYLIYGSLVVVIGLVVFLGILKIKSIHRTREQRQHQVDQWKH